MRFKVKIFILFLCMLCFIPFSVSSAETSEDTGALPYVVGDYALKNYLKDDSNANKRDYKTIYDVGVDVINAIGGKTQENIDGVTRFVRGVRNDDELNSVLNDAFHLKLGKAYDGLINHIFPKGKKIDVKNSPKLKKAMKNVVKSFDDYTYIGTFPFVDPYNTKIPFEHRDGGSVTFKFVKSKPVSFWFVYTGVYEKDKALLNTKNPSNVTSFGSVDFYTFDFEKDYLSNVISIDYSNHDLELSEKENSFSVDVYVKNNGARSIADVPDGKSIPYTVGDGSSGGGKKKSWWENLFDIGGIFKSILDTVGKIADGILKFADGVINLVGKIVALILPSLKDLTDLADKFGDVKTNFESKYKFMNVIKKQIYSVFNVGTEPINATLNIGGNTINFLPDNVMSVVSKLKLFLDGFCVICTLVYIYKKSTGGGLF